MNGKDLKRKIAQTGKTQKEIAELLGVTAQSVNAILSATDVRSGTIEKLSKALCVPVSYFYDDEASSVTVSNGENSVANSGSIVGNVHSGNTDALQKENELLKKLLDEKERTIEILMSKK